MVTTGKSDIHTNVFLELQNKDGQAEYIAASISLKLPAGTYLLEEDEECYC